jgi:hypothetical protein
MTAPKSKYPIESFGPELMAALLKGSRERLVVPFVGESGKRMAHSFQKRIHTLRQRMREEKHPSYVIAARAMVSIFWGERAVGVHDCAKEWGDDYNGNRGAIIVIRPRDSEFTDILAEVGVAPTQAVPEPLHHDVSVLTVDDLLSDLEGK